MKTFTKTLDKPLDFYLSKLKDYPLIMKEEFVRGKKKYVFILKKTENELDDYARCSTGKRIYFVSMYLQKNKGRNTIIIDLKVWYLWVFPIIFIFFLYNAIRFSLIMDKISLLTISVLIGFYLSTFLFGYLSLKIIKLTIQCYKKIIRLKAIIATLK